MKQKKSLDYNTKLLIYYIWNKKFKHGSSITQKKIAELFDVSSSQVSRVIKDVEEDLGNKKVKLIII